MLEHAVGALPATWPVYVGTTSDNLDALREILPADCCIDVGEETSGQADTIIRMLQKRAGNVLSDRQPCIILNSDVSIDTSWSEFQELMSLHDLVVGVHESNDPSCSYVDRLEDPQKFAEKKVLSPWAMSGVWGIGSSLVLLRALLVSRGLCEEVQGEFYLSSALNHLPPAMLRTCVLLPGHRDLGTPENVEKAGGRIIETASESAR